MWRRRRNQDAGGRGHRLAHHRFDPALLGWSDDPTPSGIAQTFTTAAISGVNYGAYASPEFDRLVAAATNAPTPAAARVAWRDAYATINADAPAVWFFTPTQMTVVNRRFGSVTIRPDQWAATIWMWSIVQDHAVEKSPAVKP